MKKGRNNKNTKNPRQKYRPDLIPRRTAPLQPLTIMVVPAVPVKITQVVTTGVTASSLNVGHGQIQDFATRFATLYQEYRIVRVKFTIELFSSTNPGLILAWIDEAQTGAPTAGVAAERAVYRFPTGSNQKTHSFVYVPSDPDDLAWRPTTSAAVDIASFRWYSDNATYGAGVVASDVGMVSALFTLQLRGFAGT